MSDIFLSYASEDRMRAAKLARLFEGEGWSVWWDQRTPTGREFEEYITERLFESRCVVVLWSTSSVLVAMDCL